MQSYNEATLGFEWKSCVLQKNIKMKGKENGLNSPTCLQPGLKKTPEKLVPQDPSKSRLPVLSKAKNPPDFHKLHQSWQDQFQKGKAVKKKSCTRPQPFNFSQRRDRSQVTTDIGHSGNPPASHRRREPLAEVTLGQKNQESKDADGKGSSEEFKADPAALASILSNVGVPVVATGKLSLAQRVPMRVSSIAQSSNSCKNMMVRSSMYAVLRSQSASSNLDRMSCFSKMQTKATDQKPVFKQNPLLKSCVPDSCLEGFVASNLDDKLQSQENPVLQQMNRAAPAQISSVTSLPLRSQEVTTVKSTPVPPVTEDAEGSELPEDKCEKNTSEVESSEGKRDPMKKAGTSSVEFVADPQALSSILSNTGVTFGNCGKLSLARRVPVQAKNVSSKSGMTSSGPVAVQATTPKPGFGRISTIAMPIKDIAFSPCRVPKTLTSDMSSSGSAKRVHQLNSSAMKSSQRYFSMSKQTFFAKTPRALALEMANKKLEAKLSDTRPSARSTVKWADELSPSVSEALCENELKIEEVAVRLFLDGECPGEADKKKGEGEESDCLKGPESLTTSEQKRTETTLPDNSDKNADVAAPAGVSQDLPIHINKHLPAPSSLTNSADPPVQYPSIVSGMKTSLPLSFLAHPAVQALQSRTLGPYSLPEIARLRIQAAVSAKQRFWETCLDEECAFYTSRGTGSSYRDCIDPVSSFLERQEDLHFTPIVPGEP